MQSKDTIPMKMKSVQETDINSYSTMTRSGGGDPPARKYVFYSNDHQFVFVCLFVCLFVCFYRSGKQTVLGARSKEHSRMKNKNTHRHKAGDIDE